MPSSSRPFHFVAIFVILVTALCAVPAPGDNTDLLGVQIQRSCGEDCWESANSFRVHRFAEPGVINEAAPDRYRILISGVPDHPKLRVDLRVLDRRLGDVIDEQRGLELSKNSEGEVVSQWFAITGSMEERSSPGVGKKLLFARLLDVIQVRYRLGGSRSQTMEMKVGSDDNGPGDDGVLKLPVRVVVLRGEGGGSPIIGGDEAGAAEIVRHQVAVANEVFSQCHITLGEPSDVQVVVADPPGGTMIAVGEHMPVLSMGAVLSFTVNGKPVGPVVLGTDYTPEETARLVAHEIRGAGFVAKLSVNPLRPNESFSSADVVVLTESGLPVEIVLGDQTGNQAGGTSRGILAVGRVSQFDGIDSYGPGDISTGTLEERTLLRVLSDGDRATADVFVVSGFSDGAKQGESFTGSVQGYLGRSAILDWKAFGRTRQAYVFAHELGHLLLDSLEHPDDLGDSRPWLLMNSNAVSAFAGPRIITSAQCDRMREALRR